MRRLLRNGSPCKQARQASSHSTQTLSAYCQDQYSAIFHGTHCPVMAPLVLSLELVVEKLRLYKSFHICPRASTWHVPQGGFCRSIVHKRNSLSASPLIPGSALLGVSKPGPCCGSGLHRLTDGLITGTLVTGRIVPGCPVLWCPGLLCLAPRCINDGCTV